MTVKSGADLSTPKLAQPLKIATNNIRNNIVFISMISLTNSVPTPQSEIRYPSHPLLIMSFFQHKQPDQPDKNELLLFSAIGDTSVKKQIKNSPPEGGGIELSTEGLCLLAIEHTGRSVCFIELFLESSTSISLRINQKMSQAKTRPLFLFLAGRYPLLCGGLSPLTLCRLLPVLSI